MGHRLWLARTALAGGAAPVPLVARAAHADHGGALRSVPMDPLTAGILTGLVLLAACVVIGLVARRYRQRRRSPR